MPDDVIWIQDYHLLGCARYIRDAGLTNQVGFFLHQPFPSGRIFEAAPDWRWLAESLLCCDLGGFQTVQDMNINKVLKEKIKAAGMPFKSKAYSAIFHYFLQRNPCDTFFSPVLIQLVFKTVLL